MLEQNNHSLDHVRERRLVLFLYLIPVLLLMLIVRLWWIQIVQGPVYQREANINHQRTVVIQPLRGIIYDRYDQQLVENAPSWSISLIPADIPAGQLNVVLYQVSVLAHVEFQQLQIRVRDDPYSAVVPVVLVPNIQRDEAFSILSRLNQLPGIYVDYQPQRQYDNGPAFSPVVGYVGLISNSEYLKALHSSQPYTMNSLVGKAGVEQVFEQDLRGTVGRETLEVDATGRIVQRYIQTPAIPGDSVELTIEANVQRAAYDALMRLIDAGKATSGAVVAIDPRNGAVIALVSAPSYNPNQLSQGLTSIQWDQLTSNPAHPLVNHALGSQYPPGSILDPFLAAAELQGGILANQRPVTCPGHLIDNSWIFNNSTVTPTSVSNVTGALAGHCDTLFIGLSGHTALIPGFTAGLGHTRLLNWLKQFGFGEVTTIDLPGEASGFLPTPSWYTHTLHTTWTPIDTLLVASGAGPDAITPIQLAVATASLANGGKVWQPQILQRLIAPSGRVLTQLQTHLLRSIPISLETRALITQALEAHEKTFDQALALPPVAGISAIATSPDTEGTIPVVDSWWTGFASSQDPQIALSVIVVDDPIGTEASQVARTVLQAYFHPSHTGDS